MGRISVNFNLLYSGKLSDKSNDNLSNSVSIRQLVDLAKIRNREVGNRREEGENLWGEFL